MVLLASLGGFGGCVGPDAVTNGPSAPSGMGGSGSYMSSYRSAQNPMEGEAHQGAYQLAAAPGVMGPYGEPIPRTAPFATSATAGESAAEEIVRDIAAELETPTEVSAHALAMLQRSLSVTLVRMCQACEAERARAEEERTRYEKALEFKATHDALTKLPNRALILDRLEQMLVRSRHSGAPVAALFIDLDDFKSVNDTLGHAAGDELLKAVAERFSGVIRDVDALGRLGGDEFVLVATGASLSSGAEALARRLLAALREPFRLGQAQTLVTLTASIGVEVSLDSSAGDLLRDADVAMYRAKWAGGDRCFMFTGGELPTRPRAPRRWQQRLTDLNPRRRRDMRVDSREDR